MAAASLASQKIEEANLLLVKLNSLTSVEGINKLKKKIRAEINFLNKGMKSGNELKEEHILCSNLGQLGALCEAASQTPQVIAVLQNFSTSHYEKIVVDVVAENGNQWIKVILRCPKALHLLFIMGGRRGVKPLNEVAEEFLIIADEHPVFYNVPKVTFWFFRGVSESLASELERLGVNVKGTRIPDDELGVPDFTVNDSDTESEDSSNESDAISSILNESCNESEEGDESDIERSLSDFSAQNANSSDIRNERQKVNSNNFDNLAPTCGTSESHNVPSTNIKKLNLDVTAVIAYVSSTTNGGANYIFTDKILTEQAMWERNNPVKANLDQYFTDAELLICQEAADHFNEIVATIGGPAEKQRALDFMCRVTIVPGQDMFENQLKIGGKVRKLSRLIFGTGQANKAITVTSNRGFVRSAEQQGIKPAVLYHEPRALTEKKESTAVPYEGT